MKFICVTCDVQMKLAETLGPVEGSLTVTFACPSCAHRIALLTNPGETQLVRALDVKIGGRSSPPEPWEFVRSMLETTRAVSAGGEDMAPGAPGDSVGSTELATGPRCPFSAVANRAAESASLPWDPSAERRLERVPDFIRPMARQGIERIAAERGYTRITEEVVEEVRGTLGF